MVLNIYYEKLSVRSAKTLREEPGKTISFILVMMAFCASGLLKQDFKSVEFRLKLKDLSGLSYKRQ